jgi:hypothetical protein
VREATRENVDFAFVAQGYTGAAPATAAEVHGIELEVVKPPRATPVLCLVAPALGDRAQFCLGEPFSPAGARLRTTAGNGRGVAFCRLCLPDAPTIDQDGYSKSITPSSDPRVEDSLEPARRSAPLPGHAPAGRGPHRQEPNAPSLPGPAPVGRG